MININTINTYHSTNKTSDKSLSSFCVYNNKTAQQIRCSRNFYLRIRQWYVLLEVSNQQALLRMYT